MKVKDVIVKYNAKVPFPATSEKIKKAGYNPIRYCFELVGELICCEDFKEAIDKALSK